MRRFRLFIKFLFCFVSERNLKFYLFLYVTKTVNYNVVEGTVLVTYKYIGLCLIFLYFNNFKKISHVQLINSSISILN